MDGSELGDSFITWEDSTDVYKPTPRPFSDFLNSINHKSETTRQSGPYLFFSAEAWSEMHAHSRLRLDREQGGILAGRVFEDTSGVQYVSIEAALPANGAEASATHLRFSHASWESICKTYKLAQEQTFVGWYHTHPGLGVFMSGTDKRTQALFFNQPWHVAIVIDPKKHAVGIFYGPDAIQLQPYLIHYPTIDETSVPDTNYSPPALPGE